MSYLFRRVNISGIENFFCVIIDIRFTITDWDKIHIVYMILIYIIFFRLMGNRTAVKFNEDACFIVSIIPVKASQSR